MRTLIFIAFTVVGVSLALMLGGCAPAMTVHEKQIDGIPYTLYLDHPEPPCGHLKHNEGCTVTPRGGKPSVYISSIAPAWVVEHEEAHVQGMSHSEWKQTPNGFCANVYWGGVNTKYARGDTICNNGGTERIIRL